jgi:hypothetical protein
MGRKQTVLVLAVGLALAAASEAAAQATGTPAFNAPYRAFQRSEIGVLVSFPDGGGTAFEGAYRMSSRRFDVGFKVGIFDSDVPSADAVFLAGVEGRQRVITHSADFPLDGAFVVGVGGQFVSGSSVLIIPFGLSLGRRINVEGSQVSIVPYVQPTGMFTVNGSSDFLFALGLGADFRLTPRFDARISAGLGDLEGVTIGAVWVH